MPSTKPFAAKPVPLDDVEKSSRDDASLERSTFQHNVSLDSSTRGFEHKGWVVPVLAHVTWREVSPVQGLVDGECLMNIAHDAR